MADSAPRQGRLVIDWTLGQIDGQDEFAWDIRTEPPGLTDDQIAQLLEEIAARF